MEQVDRQYVLATRTKELTYNLLESSLLFQFALISIAFGENTINVLVGRDSLQHETLGKWICSAGRERGGTEERQQTKKGIEFLVPRVSLGYLMLLFLCWRVCAHKHTHTHTIASAL